MSLGYIKHTQQLDDLEALSSAACMHTLLIPSVLLVSTSLKTSEVLP